VTGVQTCALPILAAQMRGWDCTMELDNSTKYLVSSPIVKEITRDSSFPDTTTREQDQDEMDKKPSPRERALLENGFSPFIPIDCDQSVHDMGTQLTAMDSNGTWADWNDSDSITSGIEDLDQTWENTMNQN